ncbi:unnamed protein product [Soboliphyme baturini]|uniref:AMP-binding domain-containing protein n=1 Tax=Soboliphyme baturini TaxID=241478 RepID=A0A183J7C2_9BILA|nr:unnamed protein product [Soboliphyme baturini]
MKVFADLQAAGQPFQNPQHSAPASKELQKCFSMTDVKFVMCSKELLNKVRASSTHSGSLVQKIFVMDQEEINNKFGDTIVALSDSDFKRNAAVPLPKIRFTTRLDPALLLFSSGTTGFPKAVMISHYNLSASMDSDKA